MTDHVTCAFDKNAVMSRCTHALLFLCLYGGREIGGSIYCISNNVCTIEVDLERILVSCTM